MVQVVLCNCPVEEAPELARALVEERVAACVNIIEGVQSVYRWEGEVVVEEESTLVIKSRPARYGALEAAIEAHHSYEVPEIIALEAAEVADAYQRWVHEEV